MRAKNTQNAYENIYAKEYTFMYIFAPNVLTCIYYSDIIGNVEKTNNLMR